MNAVVCCECGSSKLELRVGQVVPHLVCPHCPSAPVAPPARPSRPMLTLVKA